MPIGIDRPRLPGLLFSGQSVAVNFGFGPYDGIYKGSRGVTRERALVMASRKDGVPAGVTAGIVKPGILGFDFAEETVMLIRQQLAQKYDPNGISYGDAIGWTVSYSISEANTLLSAPPIIHSHYFCWVQEDTGDLQLDSAEKLVANLKVGFISSDANGFKLLTSQS